MHIPGLISIERLSDPQEVAELARSEALDRRFEGGKGLISRWIARRAAVTLAVGGRRFPSVAPMGDAARAEAQKALYARLADAAPDTGLAGELGAYLLGRRTQAEMEICLQSAIGQLFAPGFQASTQSRADAGVLNAAPREFNPLKLLKNRWSGAVDAARGRLASQVGSDPVAMHGISVAVQSFAASLTELRKLAQTPGALGYLDATEAARRALRPPETILRQAVSEVRLGDRVIRKGALCAVNLREAYDRAIDLGPVSGQEIGQETGQETGQTDLADNLGFMEAGWSYCPAATWVRNVMISAWSDAQDGAVAASALEPETGTPRFRAHMIAGRSAARQTFRRLWRIRLAVDLALSVLALVFAGWLGHFLFPYGSALHPEGMVRLWGLMLLLTVLFQAPTWTNVVKWNWPIYIGLAMRPVLAVAYIALGGLWFGLFELVFWALLAAAYYKLMVRALQTNT